VVQRLEKIAANQVLRVKEPASGDSPSVRRGGQKNDGIVEQWNDGAIAEYWNSIEDVDRKNTSRTVNNLFILRLLRFLGCQA
jgi:hypothetical protein